jgi:hypothetical protein
MTQRALLAAAMLAGALIAPCGARARVLVTRDQALAAAFPGATFERRSIVLDDGQADAVQRHARARLASRVYGAYVAIRGDSLLGVAFFDTRIVRTMPGVFMTVVAPDTTVARVDVLAFHEPDDYLPPGRWLAQFEGRPPGDGLRPRRDIRNISGASLTAQSVSESVRLSLAIYALVLAPALAWGDR